MKEIIVTRFHADIPFSEGIRESIQWYLSHPYRCTIDEEFNELCDKIISFYEKGFAD